MVILYARRKWVKVIQILVVVLVHQKILENTLFNGSIVNGFVVIIINSNSSCAPAWTDSDGASYIIFLLLFGWIFPNAIIFGSSFEVLRYQRKVITTKSFVRSCVVLVILHY